MSSIGPQLPPHLQSYSSKRKSPPSESTSPPAKRVANENEIALDDSNSDDGYGSKPSGAPAAQNANKDEINLDSESEDDMGPAPPPQPVSAPTQPPEDDDSSSSEDDYGPSLPSASNRAPIGPSLPPSAAEEDTAPKRDNWMLAPPPSGPLSVNDPSKIAARSFSSKPSSRPKEGASSIWTETPEEKLARLQASVLGKSDPNASATSHKSTSQKSKDDEAKERRIKENFEAARGKSMVEEARERRKTGGKAVDEEGDDDPSKRAFDREKDMAIGGRFSGKERREMMESAKDKSRFSKGTFL